MFNQTISHDRLATPAPSHSTDILIDIREESQNPISRGLYS
jgi:hypothetical protein